MQRLKKGLLASALITSIFNLTGCGEGASNAQAILQTPIAVPPDSTKTMIDISNDSDRTYVRAILVDSGTGNTLKQEQIDCKAHASNCMLYLPNKISHSATLIVQDSQQRMIGAFTFPSDGVKTYSYVNPNNKSTGEYLDQRLLKEYLSKDKIDAESATLRLQNFFQDYIGSDGSADPYAELGDYYALQTSTSPITENQFLENLAKRLINWEVAKPDELPKPKKQAALSNSQKIANAFSNLVSGKVNLIAEAQAQTANTGSCSQQTKDFLKIASTIGKVVPKAGSAISGAADMGTKACGDDPTSKILSAITQLRTDVENVNKNVNALASYTYDKDIRDTNDAFWKIHTDTEQYINGYNIFLKEALVPTKKDGTKTKMAFNSLEAYFSEFKSRGYTTEETIKFGSNQLGQILNTANVVNQLAGSLPVPNMTTYTAALNSRCAAPMNSRPNENFLSVRTFCNSSIMSNVAILVGTQAGLVGILKDVYSTIEKHQINPNDYIKPVGVQSYSATGINNIEGLFRKSQGTVLQPILDGVTATGDTSKGYFNLYAGLPKPLSNNLIARNCAGIGNGKENLPSITGWFVPTNQEKENYIETECQLINANANNSKRPVKARYYYTYQGNGIDANDVANVLGVPVAMHYVKTGKPFLTTSVITEQTSGGYVEDSPVFDAPFLVAFNNEENAGLQTGVIPSKDNKSRNYVLHTSPSGSGIYEAKIPSASAGDKSLGYTWLSLKDKNNYHYVAKLGMFYSTGGSERPSSRWFNLACETYECQADPTTHEWLVFRSGFVADISKRPNGKFQLGPLQ